MLCYGCNESNDNLAIKDILFIPDKNDIERTKKKYGKMVKFISVEPFVQFHWKWKYDLNPQLIEPIETPNESRKLKKSYNFNHLDILIISSFVTAAHLLCGREKSQRKRQIVSPKSGIRRWIESGNEQRFLKKFLLFNPIVVNYHFSHFIIHWFAESIIHKWNLL